MSLPPELRTARLLPVAVVDDVRQAVPLGAALTEGGLPVIEVTLRAPAAVDAVAALAAAGEVLVGAGTVRTPAQVDAVVAAGARFVVSPGTSAAVLGRCREHGVPAVAGAVTATEVQAAVELGACAVKFFPAATSGGTPALRALAAPFPDVEFVPTGGIGPDTLADWLAVPGVVAVGGSWMVPQQVVGAGDLDAVREATRRACALVAELS